MRQPHHRLQLQYLMGAVLLSPLLPLAYLQGKQLLRHFERNPVMPPSGKTEGMAGTGNTQSLHMLMLGESTVEGIGVDVFEDSLCARLAEALAKRGRLHVCWKAVGKSGATAAISLKEQLPQVKELGKYQLIVLVLGANDSFALTSPLRWLAQIKAMVAHILSQNPQALLYLASLPPVGKFPALPQPTRWLLGRCNTLLCKASALLAKEHTSILYSKARFNNQKHLLSPDGIHPSAAGYARWADAIADEVLPLLQTTAQDH